MRAHTPAKVLDLERVVHVVVGEELLHRLLEGRRHEHALVAELGERPDVAGGTVPLQVLQQLDLVAGVVGQFVQFETV